jgi:hypothetical protein
LVRILQRIGVCSAGHRALAGQGRPADLEQSSAFQFLLQQPHGRVQFCPAVGYLYERYRAFNRIIHRVAALLR